MSTTAGMGVKKKEDILVLCRDSNPGLSCPLPSHSLYRLRCKVCVTIHFRLFFECKVCVWRKVFCVDVLDVS